MHYFYKIYIKYNILYYFSGSIKNIITQYKSLPFESVYEKIIEKKGISGIKKWFENSKNETRFARKTKNDFFS